MPSLREIALEAGVSITTASRILNNGKHAHQISPACADRVRAVAEKLGYTANYHARSMKLGRAETIGITVDLGEPKSGDYGKLPPLALPYFSGMLGGIERHLRSISYRSMLIGVDAKMRAPDRGLVEIRQRRIDGLIVFGNLVRQDKTNFLAQQVDDPVVILDYDGETSLPVVNFDDELAVKLAIDHLKGLGHREILWVAEQRTGRPPTLRERFFMSAMWDANLRGRSCTFDLEQLGEHRWADQSTADGARQAVAQLLADGPRTFTAVVAYNDAAAIGASNALMDSGVRIPRDVSVVGFDDVFAGVAYPRLTSVSHKYTAMGQRAAELVMEMVNDRMIIPNLRRSKVMIQPELIVRASTGPAPAA